MSRTKHEEEKRECRGIDSDVELGFARFGTAFKQNPTACRFASRWESLLHHLAVAGIKTGPRNPNLDRWG